MNNLYENFNPEQIHEFWTRKVIIDRLVLISMFFMCVFVLIIFSHCIFKVDFTNHDWIATATLGFVSISATLLFISFGNAFPEREYELKFDILKPWMLIIPGMCLVLNCLLNINTI